MADRHRVLVLDELKQLRAGERGEWSGRAVGGLARILTRRHSNDWDGLEIDRLPSAADDNPEVEAWVLDWLRLVSYTPPITTGQAVAAATLRALDAVHRRSIVEAAVAVAEATSAACDLPVRAAGGWVSRVELEHVQRLVSRALEWTERVREARMHADPLARRARWNAEAGQPTRSSCSARQTASDAW